MSRVCALAASGWLAGAAAYWVVADIEESVKRSSMPTR
jgi:hypothetical protein